MRFYSAVRCNNERVTATYNLACHCNLIKRSADNKTRGDVSGQDETKMKLEKRRWEEERWDERKPDEEIGGDDRMGEEMRTGRKIWAEERSWHERRREDMRGYERKSTGVFPGFSKIQGTEGTTGNPVQKTLGVVYSLVCSPVMSYRWQYVKSGTAHHFVLNKFVCKSAKILTK